MQHDAPPRKRIPSSVEETSYSTASLIESRNFLRISKVSVPFSSIRFHSIPVGSIRWPSSARGTREVTPRRTVRALTSMAFLPFPPPPTGGTPFFVCSGSHKGCLGPVRHTDVVRSSSDLPATLKQDVRSHGAGGRRETKGG